MEKIIHPGRLSGRTTPPCSKSYAQRALAASLLAEGGSVLHNIECCDDTLAAMRCIETLGATVRHLGGDTFAIDGGLQPRSDTLRTGESGLATRLFTPLAALVGQPMQIVGEGSLLRRPMGPMIDTLRRLGVRIDDCGGRLPLTVCGPLQGGETTIDGSISSQFITGLLLALPLARQDTVLHVSEPVSVPYLDITLDTAARFGIRIDQRDYEEFYIKGAQRYQPTEFAIEGDWSAAAMLLVAGAVAGEVTVDQLQMLSKQADTAICTALVRAGASVISEPDAVTAAARPLRAFEFDATHCPDLFPALAVLAACAEGTSRLRGTVRLTHKESDRAVVLREEFAKLGIEIDLSEENTMLVRGGAIRGGVTEAHGDHRIAMALAVAALRADSPVTIAGAECVAKSYPTFFETLAQLRQKP